MHRILILTLAFLSCCCAAMSQSASSPQNLVIGHNNAGVRRLNANDLSGAIKEFDNAIKLDASYLLAYENRAIANRKLGNFQGALADYIEIARLKPKEYYPHYGKGLMLHLLGNDSEAYEEFCLALRQKPSAQTDCYWYIHAFLHELAGNIKAAINNLEKAITIVRFREHDDKCYMSPADDIRLPIYYQDLARMKQKTGDLQGALQDSNLAWLLRRHQKKQIVSP